MADSTISQLPTALTVSGSDFFPIDQGGVTKKATLAMLGNGTVIVAPGKVLTVNASLTLTGTDGTTMLFPTTSATIARTDAPQTFTGLQTFGAINVTSVNGLTLTASTGTFTLAALKTFTVNNTVTLTGTDGVTITLPTTSATMARTDAGQTFTGTQTFSDQITSTVATGTPPLVIASTTNVPNLNASSLNGATMAAPGAIGGGTAAAANFTTVGVTGQITSTLATGTAPLVVSSTTPVLNLYAALNAALAGSSAQAFSVLPATTSTNAPAASQIRIKNDIINGQFRIAQAGTSFAAPASGAYDLDGWLNSTAGTTAVTTIAQVAGETVGKFARQVTVTTADAAVAAGDVLSDSTLLEGYNTVKYVGNTFTIAFRAKVPVAGIHCVSLRNSAIDRSYVHEINFPVANTYQDCSFTVVGGFPTAGTWNYTNGIGLNLSFCHMCGSTFQTTPDAWNTGNFHATANQVNDCATNANAWEMEDVRIALGTFCPPDDSTYDEDLRYCQRYFQSFGGIQNNQILTTGGMGANATTGVFSYQFPVVMRSTPTLGYSAVTDWSISDSVTGTTSSALATAGNGSSIHQIYINATVASGLTQYRPYMLQSLNINARMTFSARL